MLEIILRFGSQHESLQIAPSIRCAVYVVGAMTARQKVLVYLKRNLKERLGSKYTEMVNSEVVLHATFPFNFPRSKVTFSSIAQAKV